MAKKEKVSRSRKTAKESGPGLVGSWFQLILGIIAIALAANLYFNYYILPKGTTEFVLVIIGCYQLFRTFERAAWAKRKQVLLRHI